MFFSLIIIVTVIFSIFGGIFIKLSFDNSLSRELSRKQNENQMFVYSFEASASMLSSDTEYIQKNDIEKIIDSVKRSMGESQIGITIVNQKEKAIYTDSKIEKNIKIKKVFPINQNRESPLFGKILCINLYLFFFYINRRNISPLMILLGHFQMVNIPLFFWSDIL